jgi:TonB-linked SusC/RagA family outer membrane protein
MEKKYIILSLCLSFILAFALPVSVLAQDQAQQTQLVKGTIVDEKGEPVIGATVKIDGTASGTITDINGHFELKVPLKSKLQISYVGYVSQVVSDLKNPLIVLKEDTKVLDEVVVMGYGSQKMKNVTGAVETISPKDVGDLSVSNLGNALSGVANGLSVSGGDTRPGDAASMTIRQSTAMVAYSSFSNYVADPSPLYVIDDYICPDATAFNALDASMIESITVLKDASAAVYGYRAGQGVILVKTKRGKVGAPKITYTSTFGTTNDISQPKMLDSYDYGVIWNQVKGAPSTTSSSTINDRTDLFQSDELSAMKNLNYNLLNDYWHAAYTQKQSLNITGGTDNVTYFGGASYFSQNGNMGTNNYNRWNYQVGVDAKINKWLKASLQVSGNYGEQYTAANMIGGSNSNTDYNYLLVHPRYIPDYINGLPMVTYGVSNQQLSTNQQFNYEAIQQLNNGNQTIPQNISIKSSVEYDFGWSKLLEGLKLKLSYVDNFSNSETNTTETYVPVYYMITRGGSGNHLYTGDLSSSNFSEIEADNGHSLERAMTNTTNYQLNFYATYDRKFGSNAVSGLFTIEKAYSVTDNLDGIALDPLTFENGTSTSATGTQSTDFSRSESGILSYVGKVNYSYADKYLAEFLVRCDASTVFAPQNYWGIFPSLSLGWVMSEEPWFKNNIHGIDFFKLRGSFGLLGKDNIAPWGWEQTYSVVLNKGAVFGTSDENNIGAAMQSSAAPNVNAHWDSNYQSNLGFNLHMLRDRLSFDVDGYFDMGRDIFMQRTGATDFPTTVGTVPTAENFGAINTYGVELTVGWKDQIGRDAHYFVNLQTGWGDNKVLKRYWPALIAINGQHPNQRTDLGVWGLDCIGMFRSYQQISEYVAKYHITNYLGLSPSQIQPGMLIYRDVRGSENSNGTYQAPDGVIDNTNDLVRISKYSSNPYGFTTKFGGDWKGFSFTAQLSANWGAYTMISNAARSGLNAVSSTNTYSDLEYTNLPSFWANNMFSYGNVTDASGNVVGIKNVNAKYPNLQYTSINSLASTFWAVSAATVSLRTVTMAYNLPKSLVKKLTVEAIRLNLTCQNVLSLYNPYPDHYIDPMSGSYGSYPHLRTLTMGLNVSF